MAELNQNYQEEEITLRDVILKIKFYKNEIIKNWYLVLIFIAISLSWFLYKHFSSVPVYPAETKFLVEGSSGGSGLGSLLGQFGIKSTGKFNPYKVIEVAKSKSQMQKVFFAKLDNDFLINKIIDQYKLVDIWSEKKPEWKGFRFKNDQASKFSSLESQAFIRIYNMVVGGKDSKDYLLNFNFNEDTGIYQYNVSTEDEKISLAIINEAYHSLKEFFEEEMVSNQLGTTIILRQKADSIQRLISSKSLQVAAQQDRTMGLVVNTPGTKKVILEKEIQALTLAYAEVLKSYEIADINLKDTRPMFLKLDETYAPIDAQASSLLIEILKALLIGGLLGSGIVVIRSIFNEAMKI